MRPLTPQQAGLLAHAASGRIFLAGDHAQNRRFDRMMERGLFTRDRRLSDKGREALRAHLHAGLPIEGWKR